ncbi:hypothetical protein JOM56_005510 [Amanita muscaria]
MLFILKFTDFFFVSLFFLLVLFGLLGPRYSDVECHVIQSESATSLQHPMVPKWDPCAAAHHSKDTAPSSWEKLQWAY